ncbi:aromatic ring-opening dioxygenase subunit LigA [Paraburkholderia sp. Ac-20347]|uniref:aromatic ring-opening dioxygenase subunit LigA n=1 Tax=Paraburkholderia sp. Ac-20347 TaxID=2703892 RepID=UPI00197D794F|nr:aromatic ring-opening dioxygenase subunit LigA [Paraburkholderia sp. Ac-20347]MBN3813742.1 aromatic ring-opening dioxygenase subunit LigA [Paraburkholderia sp. Ac-20347]
MSLYALQKFLYDLNRDSSVQDHYRRDRKTVLNGYRLIEEERRAIDEGDLGLIYVLGANGQLLMHFAAFLGVPWAAYIQALRDGVSRYGPVRAGVYAMTTSIDEKVAGV